MQALTQAERDEIQRAETRQRLSAPTVSDLIDRASAIYGVSPAAILGPRRTFRYVRARHWVFHWALAAGRSSASEIGRRMNRDHSSVLYGAAAHAIRHRLPVLSACCARKLQRTASLATYYEGPEPGLVPGFDLTACKAWRALSMAGRVA
tara:strand:- start:513 stop:962 length:450 start_codon:yes stop_codon:yes gene_type:complete